MTTADGALPERARTFVGPIPANYDLSVEEQTPICEAVARELQRQLRQERGVGGDEQQPGRGESDDLRDGI
jgi:hypothetical protein